MVLRLASALDIPLSDRNSLLAAAGLPPEYPTHALADEAMRPIATILDKVLAGHEPCPAWVYARGLRALRCNAAAEALFPGLCGLLPRAIVDLWFDASLCGVVEKWIDCVWAGLDSLRREAQHSSDLDVLVLLKYAESRAHQLPISSSAWSSCSRQTSRATPSFARVRASDDEWARNFNRPACERARTD